MSAVVGLLKVSLQAETAELTRGFADAEKSGQRFAKQIEGVGRAAAGGLAAAGAAVIAMTMRTAAAGDELNKLSARVGVSVESLSRLKYAAEQNDTSISVLQNGMQRLARSMADAQNQSSASAKAFDAIGVSTTNADGSLRGIDRVLLDVAEAFANSGDAAAKAALAQQLFGRAGMELLPFLQNGKSGLQDLGDEAERLGITFTTEGAAAATEFQDNLTRLQAVGTGLAYSIGNALIPTINRLSDEFLDARAAGLSWWESMTRIGLSNPFKTHEEHAAAARKEIERLQKLVESGGRAGTVGRRQIEAEIEVQRKLLDYHERRAGIVKTSMEGETAATDDAAAAIKKYIEGLRTANAAAAARAARERELAAAAAAHKAALAAQAAERARELDAARDGLRSIGEQIRAQREYNEEIGLSARAIADLRYNRMQATAAQLDERAATIALFDPNSDLIELYRQQAAALRELADAQRDGAIAQASADAARDAAGEWQRTADSIEQTLTDALMRAFEGGASFADALRQTLINMFNTMVLRPIIAPIAGGMAGMFAGPAGAGSQAWPGAGGGGGMGGVNPMAFLGGNSIGMAFSNIATWLSTSPMLAGTGVGNAMMGWAGNVAGLSNLGFGLAGLGGGLLGNWLFDGKGYSGLGGSLGGTVGYALGAGSAGMLGSLGWAAGPLGALGGAVLGSFLGSLFGGSGERFPRTVSSSTGYWDSERSEWVGTGRDESWQHSNRRQFGDSMDQAMDELQRQFSVRIASLLEAFGFDEDISTTARVRLRRTSGRLASWFSGTIGDEEFKAGGEYGKDAEIQKSFEQFVNDVMTKGIAAAVEASPLAQNIKDIFGEGLSLEQSDFALDALISAATGLSDLDRAPAVFQRLESALTDVIEAASFEELSDAAGEFAVLNESMTLFYDAFTSNADKFRDAQNSLLYAFEDLDVAMPRSIDEFYRMADALDLSTEEGRELFNELMALAPAFLTVAGAVEQVFDAISRSTADTIESFMLDTMSAQEKYAYFDEQIANALLEMAEANDPETIARLYEEANADLRAAWALLDDDEKQRLRDEFIERAYQLEEEAQARLSVVPSLEESLDAQHEAAAAVGRAAGALEQVAGVMEAVAEHHSNAAGGLASAISALPERIIVESNVIVTEVGR